MKYEITDIDYWEKDAILVVEGRDRFYFQFSEGPYLEEALVFLFREGFIMFSGSNMHKARKRPSL